MRLSFTFVLLPTIVSALSWNAYDLGLNGIYPTQSYVSFDLDSPSVKITKWDDRCDSDGAHLLLSPRGKMVPSPGPVMLDARGNLVWMEERFGQAMNFQVQTYKGRDYLTFWSGTSEGAHSNGSYYMLDSSYEIAHTVSAVGNDLRGDLHEFKITDNGTALITVFEDTAIDCSDIGLEECWVNDCIFQEIDIESGNLIFEWRASNHIALSDSYKSKGSDGKSKDKSWDFFHINSIDKDAQGNYLISARHMHTIYCINPTGTTLWTLGGKHSSFKDLSSGYATNFAWQHHANWHPNNTLSLFDNNGNNVFHNRAEFSRGILLSLDLDHMTATLLQTYVHPNEILAISQGSMQIIPENGHVLVGFGNSPVYTEFTGDGEVLCSAHFGAALFYELLDIGWVKSYRAFKRRWIGTPKTDPSIKLQDGQVFVSWNGATEVKSWRLQSSAANGTLEDFGDVDERKREGFETSFDLDGITDHFIRVAALNAAGEVLEYTKTVDRTSEKSVSTWRFIIVGCYFVTMAVVMWLFRAALREIFSKMCLLGHQQNFSQEYELVGMERPKYYP